MFVTMKFEPDDGLTNQLANKFPMEGVVFLWNSKKVDLR